MKGTRQKRSQLTSAGANLGIVFYRLQLLRHNARVILQVFDDDPAAAGDCCLSDSLHGCPTGTNISIISLCHCENFKVGS